MYYNNKGTQHVRNSLQATYSSWRTNVKCVKKLLPHGDGDKKKERKMS